MKKCGEAFRIYAPFREESVDNINEYQRTNDEPFMCNGKGISCEVKRGKGKGVMIGTVKGLHCPCGAHKQNWALKEMIKYEEDDC